MWTALHAALTSRLAAGCDEDESQEEDDTGVDGRDQRAGRQGTTAALRASLARWKARCRELRNDMATAAAQAAAQIAALQVQPLTSS